jgi:hypothetical protein
MLRQTAINIVAGHFDKIVIVRAKANAGKYSFSERYLIKAARMFVVDCSSLKRRRLHPMAYGLDTCW